MRFMSMINRKLLAHPELVKTTKYYVMRSNIREEPLDKNYLHNLNILDTKNLDAPTLYANVAVPAQPGTGTIFEKVTQFFLKFEVK